MTSQICSPSESMGARSIPKFHEACSCQHSKAIRFLTSCARDTDVALVYTYISLHNCMLRVVAFSRHSTGWVSISQGTILFSSPAMHWIVCKRVNIRFYSPHMGRTVDKRYNPCKMHMAHVSIQLSDSMSHRPPEENQSQLCRKWLLHC